jgi:CheY-like chemotaxis protein/HPt (histidine-containing phosphotransfer) domain-containing protein
MSDEQDRRRAFETRLDELRQRMEAGLLARAHILREAVKRLLAGDDSARRVLKQEGHKLRGIAGSYGHEQLTELATELERRASLSPPPQLEELATRLADAAEAVGKRSKYTPSHPLQNTSALQPTALEVAPIAKPRKRGASSRPQARGAHGGPLRVLAMDDDPTTLRLLQLTLNDIGGFDSVLVTSAHAALLELQKREFDVVISDAMMPDMNGREFCSAARKLGGLAAEVPIIILSAATQDELHWRSGLPGPVVWLRKPFMPSALVKDVARVALSHRSRS